MNEKNRRRQEGVSNLICDMFRENLELLTKDRKELESFIHASGIALHNIPFLLSGEGELQTEELRQINKLDPDGKDNLWGPWSKRLAASFNQELPSLRGI